MPSSAHTQTYTRVILGSFSVAAGEMRWMNRSKSMYIMIADCIIVGENKMNHPSRYKCQIHGYNRSLRFVNRNEMPFRDNLLLINSIYRLCLFWVVSKMVQQFLNSGPMVLVHIFRRNQRGQMILKRFHTRTLSTNQQFCLFTRQSAAPSINPIQFPLLPCRLIPSINLQWYICIYSVSLSPVISSNDNNNIPSLFLLHLLHTPPQVVLICSIITLLLLLYAYVTYLSL